MEGPPVYVSEDGIFFTARESTSRQIFEIPEYRISDIRADDQVIDIGANVGAFALRAAKVTPHVLAIEPLMAPVLEENVRLNKAELSVLAAALGNGKPSLCTWDDHSAVVPTFTLGALVSMAGGCDFLKCDCEGAEWQIRPRDLDGIRRIEMELHLPPISPVPPSQELLDYIALHYDFEIERKPCHDILGVMGVLHAART